MIRRNKLPTKQRFESPLLVSIPSTNKEEALEFTVIQHLNTGSCLWDASIVLASFVAKHCTSWIPSYTHSDDCRPRNPLRILELGAGCALPSLTVKCLLPDAHVVATELGDEMNWLLENLDRNKSNVKAMEYFWGDKETSDDMGKFDVILGADIVYELQHFSSLLAALRDTSHPNTVIYLCTERRWKDVESWFMEDLKNDGWILRVLSDHELGLAVQRPQEIEVWEIRRRRMERNLTTNVFDIEE